jgi:ATP-dependent Zn protease
MPDETESTTATQPDKKETAPLTEEQKEKVSNAKGSLPKKALWWLLGIFGVVLIIGLVLFFVLRKGGPSEAIKQVVNKTKNEVSKADIEAKIKAAEAAGVEKEKIEEIKNTLEIDDVDERRKKLAELLQ